MKEKVTYSGHVDRFESGYIIGWIFNRKMPNDSATFEIFVNKKYCGHWSCQYYREDLKLAGLGHGIHGFKIPFAEDLDQSAGGLRIDIYVSGPHASWLYVRGGQIFEANTQRRTRGSLLRHLHRQMTNSGEAAGRDRNPDRDFSRTRRILSRSDTYGAERHAKIASSDFTEFLRRRNGLNADDHKFYSWYIFDYVFRVNPRSIPMSDAEEKFIKSLVEETRVEVFSRKIPKTLRYFSRKTYRKIKSLSESYWWRIEGGAHLNLHHAFVDNSVENELYTPSNYGFGSSNNLTNCMMLFLLTNGISSPFSLIFPWGRKKAYNWIRLYMDKDPHLRTSITGPISKRMEIYNPLPPRFDEVQIIGPFDRLLGLGESSRRLKEAIEENGIQMKYACYSDGFAHKKTVENYNYIVYKSCVNILHFNYEQIPDLFIEYGDLIFLSYKIIFPYWELSSISDVHKLGINLVDEIWSASDFIAQLHSELQMPVVKIGLPFKKLPELKSEVQFGDRPFTYLTTFDAFSWPQRKNAIMVVNAFLAAFENVSNVALIIKTHNTEAVPHGQRDAWLAVRESCNDDSRITIIDKTFSLEEQQKLLLSCDCLVSLHRAEGLGIDILDAIANGIPVVATAYSGNMTVCNPRNSWLVDYDLVPVSKGDYAYVGDDQRWAEPSLDRAIAALVQVYENVEERRKRSEAGVRDAKKLASPRAVSKRIERRLFELRQLFVDGEPPASK